MKKAKKKSKILVVEDEILVARDISETLTELGYKVPAFVLSAEEAIEKTAELKPDLVLMDIMLKGKIDGINAAKTIQEKYKTPVIYLTAYSSDKILPKAKATKPYGYIVKPFDQTNLYTTIEIALYKHKFEKDLLQETENALATIFGCIEILKEEQQGSLDKDVLKKIDMIKNSVEIIKEAIEQL